MSEVSWCKEFYSIPASSTPCSATVATTHSLQKWIGLRKENLQKHNLIGLPIQVGADTCALCHHYKKKGAPKECEACPLYKVRDQHSCDITNSKVESQSPWRKWRDRFDPEPMIMWLEKTLVMVSLEKNGASKPLGLWEASQKLLELVALGHESSCECAMCESPIQQACRDLAKALVAHKDTP